ncbi:hypothetical protein MSG28_011617 [Choristoneura fumiferana]|uniref:Uncharacterized protein n=1 Tax=Choristoneura fumiferana TaxID=7141 RepID=A0ACC0JNY4_CHOFU|nr:hypothetical protein MSG28_011617 [Choristoneura fumiferana]
MFIVKLKNPKLQFDDESRIGKKRSIHTGYEKLDHLLSFYDEIEHLKRIFGLTNVVAGYHSVLELPLRPGAVKHAINVVGEVCSPQFFLVEYLRSQAFSEIFEENAYTHTLITVSEDLNIGGGKSPAQVVGWTKDYVLLVGDKKHTAASEQLRQSLSIRQDSCIDFTESTEGLVLSSTNYLANPAQQKQFLQTASIAISHKLLSQTLVQDCTCGYVDPFRVRSICVNKSRKEVFLRTQRMRGPPRWERILTDAPAAAFTTSWIWKYCQIIDNTGA